MGQHLGETRYIVKTGQVPFLRLSFVGESELNSQHSTSAPEPAHDLSAVCSARVTAELSESSIAVPKFSSESNSQDTGRRPLRCSLTSVD
jgi:hypothetical protein